MSLTRKEAITKQEKGLNPFLSREEAFRSGKTKLKPITIEEAALSGRGSDLEWVTVSVEIAQGSLSEGSVDIWAWHGDEQTFGKKTFQVMVSTLETEGRYFYVPIVNGVAAPFYILTNPKANTTINVTLAGATTLNGGLKQPNNTATIVRLKCVNSSAV